MVVNLTWELGQDLNTFLPFAILIAFDDYSGLVYLSCDASIVPVFARQSRFDYYGIVCT